MERRARIRTTTMLAGVCQFLKDPPMFLLTVLMTTYFIAAPSSDQRDELLAMGYLSHVLLDMAMRSHRDRHMDVLEVSSLPATFSVGAFFSRLLSVLLAVCNVVQAGFCIMQLGPNVPLLFMSWWGFAILLAMPAIVYEIWRLLSLNDTADQTTFLQQWLMNRDIRPLGSEWQVLTMEQRMHALVGLLVHEQPDDACESLVLAHCRVTYMERLLDDARRLVDERAYRKVIHLYHLWQESDKTKGELLVCQ